MGAAPPVPATSRARPAIYHTNRENRLIQVILYVTTAELHRDWILQTIAGQPYPSMLLRSSSNDPSF